MNYSDAMLDGFKKVGGKQITRKLVVRNEEGRAIGCCAMGAVHLAGEDPWVFADAFYTAWGVMPDALNDDGMPWEHLYGMTVAAGL